MTDNIIDITELTHLLLFRPLLHAAIRDFR